MPLSNCIIQTQRRLDELTSYGYPRQPVGALRALMSNSNNSAVKQKLLTDDGKKKKYQITYVAPDCAAPLDCTDDAAQRCAPGTSKPIQSDFKEINGCIAAGNIELTIDQYRDLCNFGPDTFTQAQIMGKFDTLARRVNTSILTAICGNVGCFSATGGPLNNGNPTPKMAKELKLVDANGTPVWTADTEIQADYMDAGLSTTPMLIGGRTLLKYAKGVANGGVNNAGIDIGGMNTFPMFYDNQVDTVCNVANREVVFALAPQMVNYVNYLENVGDFQSNIDMKTFDPLAHMRNGDSYAYGTIQDPMSGLMFDMDAIFNSCDKKWILSIRSHFDTWFMRLMNCYASCFTGVLKYNVCQVPAIAC